MKKMKMNKINLLKTFLSLGILLTLFGLYARDVNITGNKIGDLNGFLNSKGVRVWGQYDFAVMCGYDVDEDNVETSIPLPPFLNCARAKSVKWHNDVVWTEMEQISLSKWTSHPKGCTAEDNEWTRFRNFVSTHENQHKTDLHKIITDNKSDYETAAAQVTAEAKDANLETAKKNAIKDVKDQLKALKYKHITKLNNEKADKLDRNDAPNAAPRQIICLCR